MSWMKRGEWVVYLWMCFVLNDMAVARAERHMDVFSFFSLCLLVFTNPHGIAPSESGFCQRFTVSLNCFAIEECPFYLLHINRALLPSHFHTGRRLLAIIKNFGYTQMVHSYCL